MRRSIFLALFALISWNVSAQKIDKEHLWLDCQLYVDNDVFTGKFYQDQYYTSGIFPAARMLLDRDSKTKVIRTYQINHKIYTPFDVRWKRVSRFDRPYAGVLSGSVMNEYYFPSNQYLKVDLELGWMGPGSGVDKSQIAYHHLFGMPKPQGWEYQIQNSPVINVNTTYIKPFISNKHLEISSESNLSLGTVYNYVRQNAIFRFGDIRPLNKSAFTGATLGGPRVKRAEPKVMETYLFYSPAIEYVIYNATLEGNLIGKESPNTMEALPWVVQHRAGLMFSWTRFDFGFIAYWRTHENERALNHDYVGIRLNQRY